MIKSFIKKIFNKQKNMEKEYTIIPRRLTDEMILSIENSKLYAMNTQLYMHYWNDDYITDEPDNPEWYNQAICFWKKEEYFEKKSLPPSWETYKERYFIIKDVPQNISFCKALAAPWFDMPGHGEKHSFKKNDEYVTLKEMYQQNRIEYLECIELEESNLNVLENTKDYYFLVDERIISVKNNEFYFNNDRISLSDGYALKGIHLMKII